MHIGCWKPTIHLVHFPWSLPTYIHDTNIVPPTAYYFPPASLKVPVTKTSRQTYCEWKGAATYWSITDPANPSDTVANHIWSYEKPTKGFEVLKDHLSFYAEPWECIVDGEKVEAQPGNFYGGWVTNDIEGIVKGTNGNWDPVV